MFLGYQNNKIAFIAETKEELEKLPLVNFDEIVETEEPYVYYNNEYLKEDDVKQREKERISMLNLTAADVERGLYKALGKDFDDIIEMASHSELVSESLDIKALKIELKANNFYRGNPYVSQLGSMLCLNEKQLDEFFETNDYTKLLKES